jgi:hypothetical protein
MGALKIAFICLSFICLTVYLLSFVILFFFSSFSYYCDVMCLITSIADADGHERRCGTVVLASTVLL